MARTDGTNNLLQYLYLILILKPGLKFKEALRQMEQIFDVNMKRTRIPSPLASIPYLGREVATWRHWHRLHADDHRRCAGCGER
jgi:hypothetical protein